MYAAASSIARPVGRLRCSAVRRSGFSGSLSEKFGSQRIIQFPLPSFQGSLFATISFPCYTFRVPPLSLLLVVVAHDDELVALDIVLMVVVDVDLQLMVVALGFSPQEVK